MPQLQMTVVDHDTFLKKLTDLFEAKKEHGSIWLTHKRLTHDGEDAVMHTREDAPSAVDTQEYPCIVRVTDGKSVKFSTKVVSSELQRFQAHYGALLKTAMAGMRKRDKRREKHRAEEAAKRKKKMTEPIAFDGTSKRGKGRRQRQRKIRALEKQQVSQKKFQEREEENKKALAA